MSLTSPQREWLNLIALSSPTSFGVIDYGNTAPEGVTCYHSALTLPNGIIYLVNRHRSCYYNTNLQALDGAMVCIEEAMRIVGIKDPALPSESGGAGVVSVPLPPPAAYPKPDWKEFDPKNHPDTGKRYVLSKRTSKGTWSYTNATWHETSCLWHVPHMDLYLNPYYWKYREYIPGWDDCDTSA